MKLTPQIALRQETRLKLSQDLQRAIGLLELSNLDLAEALGAAAADNPWLRLAAPRATAAAADTAMDEGPSLIGHVLARLPGLVPRAADRPVALALAEALDASGFVPADLGALAARTGRPLRRVEGVLAALQQIEPRGLFARSLAECLALQLAEEGPIAPEMRRVLDVLPLLAKGGPAALARETGLAPAMLETALARLRGLDPRPAARFAHAPAPTRVADLIFENAQGGWQARLNPETLPRLSLARLATAAPRGSVLARERQTAQSLIRAVERRNRSLLALGTVLAAEQAGFLSDGPAGQRPLTMRAVAARIGLHESSVGRMANSGSAATPHGTLPLRSFFCRAGQRAPSAPASLGVPALELQIRHMIRDEPPEAPLSDAEIAARLARDGHALSRRMVALLRARAGLGNRSTRRRAGP